MVYYDVWRTWQIAPFARLHPPALSYTGLSSLGVPGVPWQPQILADQFTLSQPRGVDYAHQIILAPPDFQTFRRPWQYVDASGRLRKISKTGELDRIFLVVQLLIRADFSLKVQGSRKSSVGAGIFAKLHPPSLSYTWHFQNREAGFWPRAAW